MPLDGSFATYLGWLIPCGGTVSAASPPGGGAVFTVILPAA